jgi:polar amino acid transport system substrate-binding protein
VAARAIEDGVMSGWIARRALVIGAGLAMLAGSAAADPEPRQILAPTGKLRAGLYPGTPTSILPAATPAGTRGVGYELGRELARRLGVSYEPVVFAKNAEVLDAVTSGAVDVAFTNASAARAKIMDFGPAYLEIELGLLVPDGSKLAAPGEMDGAGLRIGVVTSSSSDAALSRDLTNAAVVRVETTALGIAMLADGRLDGFATNKATLFEMADKLSGGRVLDGRWGVERHAIAIPKGRDAGLADLRQFTADAKASGLVKAAIERSGLRGAMTAGD